MKKIIVFLLLVFCSFAHADGLFVPNNITPPLSYTPTDQSGATLTFTSVNAQYVQVGNLITVYGTLTYPSTANGSSAKISLPVTAANSTNAAVPCAVFSSAVASLLLVVNANAANASFKVDISGAVLNSQLSTAVISYICTYPAS
jgi:hypothetical protein